MKLSIIPASTQTFDFYGQQAATAPSGNGGYMGAGPAYYSHWRTKLDRGFIELFKPIKDGEDLSPLTPDDPYTLKDVDGNLVNHNFLAIRGNITGYFIGASLSNYEQKLPEETGFAHCQTYKADLSTGDNTNITVDGRYPLQSSIGINYGLAKYQDPKDAAAGKPRVYGGRGFQTYGRATEQYAAQMDRPVTMSCAECIAGNKDKYEKNWCKTSGELVFYVTDFAFRGQNGLTWVPVNKLGIPEFGDGGITVVFKVGAPDLKTPKYDLAQKINAIIPASAVNANDYISNAYKTLDVSYRPFGEVEGLGFVQMLAAPTEVWVAKLEKAIGKTNHVALYNPSEFFTQNTESRHNLLQESLESYLADRAPKTEEAVEFYPNDSVALPALNAVKPALGGLQDLAAAGAFFSEMQKAM